MWEEKAEIVNEIFADLGLNYLVDEETYQLYHKEEIISDGFVYLNSTSLQHCSFFKTATFNCTFVSNGMTISIKNPVLLMQISPQNKMMRTKIILLKSFYKTPKSEFIRKNNLTKP